MKTKMPYQLVSLCYISHQTNYVSRPCNLPCHPERSGTTHQKPRATINHRRTANPAPSGAPVGGISIAERHHTTPRTTKKAFPFEGDGGAKRRMRAGERGQHLNQTYLVPRPCPPPCHLRANDFVIAAPPAKNQAHPPIIAAQRTPPQAGHQQAGSPLLRGTTQRHAPPKKPSPSRGKVARSAG